MPRRFPRKKEGLTGGLPPGPSATCSAPLTPGRALIRLGREKRIKLFRPSVLDRPPKEIPGTLTDANSQGLTIAAADGYLVVRELQLENRPRLPVDAVPAGDSA